MCLVVRVLRSVRSTQRQKCNSEDTAISFGGPAKLLRSTKTATYRCFQGHDYETVYFIIQDHHVIVTCISLYFVVCFACLEFKPASP